MCVQKFLPDWLIHSPPITYKKMSTKIHIPPSLLTTNRKKRKMSHRDVSNMIHLQKNPEILNKRRRQIRLSNTLSNPHDDFITMYLIKWPLHELIKATTLFMLIMKYEHDEYATRRRDEAYFSNHTPIPIVDADGVRFMSFASYFEMIYKSALKECDNPHIITLLRSCFLIAFMYDARIERFVMAQHSIHTTVTQTRPPSKSKVLAFLAAARGKVEAYLFREEEDICIMTRECIRLWVEVDIQHIDHWRKSLNSVRSNYDLYMR